MNNANIPYRLSEIVSNQGIRLSHAAAKPGHHCPMHTALSALRHIQGVSTLVVGMPECSFYSRYVIEGLPGGEELHYTYVLDSNEVVFGCRDGLMKALQVMQEDGAKAIMVIMTCIPALIGEDIAEITNTFSEHNICKATCIDMAHYKRNGYNVGFYDSYAALLELAPLNEDITKEGINEVAILGAVKGLEGDRLKQWLKDNSYEILEVGPRVSLELFSKVKESKLNIVAHMNYLPLAKRLEKEYDIPFIFLSGDYGVKDIHQCYEKIKDLLNLSDIPQFKYSNQVERMEEIMREELHGGRFIISSEVDHVLPLTAYLCSLGMKPCFLHIEEYQPWMNEWKEKILSYEEDPLISFVVQENIEKAVLDHSGFGDEKGLRVSIGAVQLELESVCSIQGRRAFIPPLLGYERTYYILDMLGKAVKEENHAII
jgi:nitrogenase molybdenum-iron protein alpha/beta subunit